MTSYRPSNSQVLQVIEPNYLEESKHPLGKDQLNSTMGSKELSSRHQLPVISLDHLEEMDDCTLPVIRGALRELFGLGFRTTVEPKLPINQVTFNVSSKLAGPPISDADLHLRLRLGLMPTIRQRIVSAMEYLHQRLELGAVHELRLEGTPDGRPQWHVCLVDENDVEENLLVGLTRLGYDWIFENLPKLKRNKNNKAALKTKSTDVAALEPLETLARHCLEKQTSWGFVWFPNGALFCRFYVVTEEGMGAPSPQRIGAKYKFIPHQVADHTGQLGSSLGILSWALFSCIRAHRPLYEKTRMVPLSKVIPQEIPEPSTHLLTRLGHDDETGHIGNGPSTTFKTTKRKGRNPEALDQSVKVRKIYSTNGKSSTATPGPWQGRLRSRKGNLT